MAKNVSIYIKDEFIKFFDKESNKSDLINYLLEIHYSNDLNFLKIKAKYYNEKLENINLKIQRQQDKSDALGLVVKQEKEKEIRLEIIEKFNILYNAGKITGVEYWDAYNKDKHAFNIEKCKKILKDIGELE